MAAANHFYGVPKHELGEKAFGVYRHWNREPTSPFTAGFSDDLSLPVSRWTEMRRADIEKAQGLDILMESDWTGVGVLSDDRRNLYCFNHVEFDSHSLLDEYQRDVLLGTGQKPPHNYFPDDDVNKSPTNRWRSHAHLLFGNWINTIYQTSPADIQNIGKEIRDDAARAERTA